MLNGLITTCTASLNYSGLSVLISWKRKCSPNCKMASSKEVRLTGLTAESMFSKYLIIWNGNRDE